MAQDSSIEVAKQPVLGDEDLNENSAASFNEDELQNIMNEIESLESASEVGIEEPHESEDIDQAEVQPMPLRPVMPKQTSHQSSSAPSRMEMELSGQMDLSFKVHFEGQDIIFALSQSEGVSITLAGGAKFLVPLKAA